MATSVISCMMLKMAKKKNFKNLAVFPPQNFKCMFGYFSTFCMKGLAHYCLLAIAIVKKVSEISTVISKIDILG